MVAGSTTIAWVIRARLVKRALVSSSPKVADTTSSNWWASSMTTTSCSGSNAPPASRLRLYRWVLTTTTSASAAAVPGRFGEARRALRAVGPARALAGTDADRGPRRGRRLVVELGPVAGLRSRVDHSASWRTCWSTDECGAGLRVSWVVAGRGLVHPLAAQVVGPSLEHGEGEGAIDVLGEEGQVLAGQLILQRLGGGGHHHLGPADHGRHQVGQRLARARAGLDDEGPAVADGSAHGDGHLHLTRPILARR